ncbi:MAG: RluA family pseudouridine synthase [Planctomycetaceae bacterium]|nr:RluA family pseudouridine synthase [Planctomycetaceae bacterium]
MSKLQFIIEDDANETILAHLRKNLPDQPSWSAVRKVLGGRRVTINGALCIDEARRLTKGERVTVSDNPVPPPPTDKDVVVRYVDADVIIVEKPSGMTTLRRKSEMSWPMSRRLQQPTLDECVPRMIREHAAKRNKSRRVHQRVPRLFSVHRIDRDSSGLLVFARNEEAQKAIIQQFADHKAVRKYFALIPGRLPDQTISTHFIRDRGDGLRGSTADTTVGQHAVTHVRTLRTMGDYSELECRLETGRTNQIRIHLAELGHPICGDIKYRGPLGQPEIPDESRVHRLALHAAELRFDHPTTGKEIHFETPWPPNMQRFLNRLTAQSLGPKGQS